ncbi:MAG: FecR family protein [Chthoniobacteraceae bacterium]
MKAHLCSFLLLALVSAAHAAPLTGAKITHLVNDVRTVASGQVPQPSKLNEVVVGGKAVRTGIDSRTELLFSDQTITRLGPNTHFSVSDGAREISVSQGSLLLQVQKGLGGAKIQTAAVTAAITGTTVLYESGPKFFTLTFIEGKGILVAKGDRFKRRVPILAGYQVKMAHNATQVPAPYKIKLSELVKSSPLLTGTWGARLEQAQIAAAIFEQSQQQSVAVGTLRVKGTVLVNRKPAANGDIIHNGDTIETAEGKIVIVAVIGGGEIAIDPSTKVRVRGGGTEPVTIRVIYGHAETHGLPGTNSDDVTGTDSLPYLSVFALGYFPGGGRSTSNGSVITLVLPNGATAFFDTFSGSIQTR